MALSPVPSLPNVTRIATTNLVASAGPVPLGANFPIYGAGEVDVYADGVLLAPGNYTLTSASGSPLPWTDAQVTINNPVTASIVVVGNRAPFTQDIFTDGGTTARQRNYAYIRLQTSVRELWDLKARISLVPPGVEPPDALALKDVLDTNVGPPGPAGIPGIGFIEVTPDVEYYAHVGGQPVFTIKNGGGDGFLFGSPVRLSENHPLFRVETGGRGKVRAGSLIIGDPGDTPEIGVYLAMGDPEDGAFFPLPKTSVGQQGFLQYNTPWAPGDDNPLDLKLANPNRLIKPFRLTSGPNFTASIYLTGNSTMLSDQKHFPVRFVSGSGTAPTLDVTNTRTGANTGAKAIKRNDGTVPVPGYWVAGTEVNLIWVAASNEFRATSDTDGPTGAATYRNFFMNPNWARAVGWKTRFDQAPTETSRTMSFVVENSKPGETILRERFWVSGIGSTVIGGTGSFEDAASDHGWTAEDNYPGEMENSPTDPNYHGNYFAGLPGPHNAFNTPGFGGLSVLMPSHDKWAGIAMRKSGTIDLGLDIAYDHANEWFRFDGVSPAVSSVNITNITQSPGGLCRVAVTGAHGFARREVVRVASVLGTTEANGVWTIWPVSAGVFDLLGTNFTNAYVSGGTATRANGTTRAAFKPQTGDWYFGGNPNNASLHIFPEGSAVNQVQIRGGVAGAEAQIKAVGADTNVGLFFQTKGNGAFRVFAGDAEGFRVNAVTSAENRIEVTGAALGNGPTIGVGGDDANIALNLNSKGTSSVSLNPGNTPAMRASRIASAVNFWNFYGAAAGNAVIVEPAGTDTNIGMEVRTKNDAPMRFLPGSAEALRLNRVASAVNYLGITPGAAGNGVILAAAGADSNVNLNLDSKGTGQVAINPGGTVGFRVNRVASAVNYVEIDPNVTGGDVRVSANGSDSNIKLTLRSKGTERVDISPGAVNTVRIPHVAAAVNALELKGSATGVPVDIEAGGTDVNVDLRLVPRGAGRVRFGTHVGSGDVACNGYIEIRDAGGNIRKLMTTA